MKYPSRDGTINALVQKGKPKMGMTPVWLVDKEGNLLNTEPVCIVCEKYHPWFISWLIGKFREEAMSENSKNDS